MLQKKDVSQAEAGYRAVLSRKAGEYCTEEPELIVQRMSRSSSAKRLLC